MNNNNKLDDKKIIRCLWCDKPVTKLSLDFYNDDIAFCNAICEKKYKEMQLEATIDDEEEKNRLIEDDNSSKEKNEDFRISNNKLSLTSEERETIISWNDEDKGCFLISSSQQPMIRKLLRNPLFEVKDKFYSKKYKVYPKPIRVEGYLPLRCLTIRTKLFKRNLTKEQKDKLVRRLRNGRETH